MSPGENVNQVFEGDIQRNYLDKCCTVLLSPTAKIAVIKLNCTLQYELLDIELWRCLPRRSNDRKSNRTAAGLCVRTAVSRFKRYHWHAYWHEHFFFSFSGYYRLIYFFVSFFVLCFVLTSSRVQKKFPSQQEGQEDQQVNVRVQEERNVRHGWRSHVWGGHAVPQAEWS